MVDPIGIKAVSTNDRRIAPVGSVTVVPLATRLPDQTTANVLAVSHDLAATAPVDTNRVATLRQAIADGSYSISPAQIADRLIALHTEWQA